MLKHERIEKLLHELHYEIEVGMMQGEIDETLSFVFIVPTSKNIKNGVVKCEFRTRPMHAQNAFGVGLEKPRLSVVKS